MTSGPPAPPPPADRDARTLVRFDFPPGAGPEEIAAAIRAAHDLVMARKAGRERREAQGPID